MALLAPIPRARVRTAAAVKPGVRASARAPRRASCQSVSKNRMRTSGLLTANGGGPLPPGDGLAERDLYNTGRMTRGNNGGDGNQGERGSQAITRAIILARGLGTRMRERTQGGAA